MQTPKWHWLAEQFQKLAKKNASKGSIAIGPILSLTWGLWFVTTANEGLAS